MLSATYDAVDPDLLVSMPHFCYVDPAVARDGLAHRPGRLHATAEVPAFWVAAGLKHHC
jgi:hypothetical protein